MRLRFPRESLIKLTLVGARPPPAADAGEHLPRRARFTKPVAFGSRLVTRRTTSNLSQGGARPNDPLQMTIRGFSTVARVAAVPLDVPQRLRLRPRQLDPVHCHRACSVIGPLAGKFT